MRKNLNSLWSHVYWEGKLFACMWLCCMLAMCVCVGQVSPQEAGESIRMLLVWLRWQDGHMWYIANDSTQRIMRSYSPSVSPTWRHALTIQEEEEARMVLTFEWVSACPHLVVLSARRSAWLRAPTHLYQVIYLFIYFGFISVFVFRLPPSSAPPLSAVKWL